MNYRIFVSALLCVCLLPFLALADIDKLDQQLRDHTFVYVDKKTKLEHTIYIGRFGRVYDEYFRHTENPEYPCAFVDGTWKINAAGQLCMKDSADLKRRSGTDCYKPIIKSQVISFMDEAGNLAYQSKLTKGNALPLG